MKDIEELTLYEDEVRYTGLQFVRSSVHGEGVNFVQSFPHPLLGFTSESVLVKIDDVQKVIDYLQDVLEYIKSE